MLATHSLFIHIILLVAQHLTLNLWVRCGCHRKKMRGMGHGAWHFSSRRFVASLSRLYASHKSSGPCPFVLFFFLWPTEICMQIAGLSLAYLQIEKFIALTKQCLTKHNSSYQPAGITGIWVSQRSSRPRCWDPRFFASACARGIFGNFDLQSMPFDMSPVPANCGWSPHPCGLSPSSAWAEWQADCTVTRLGFCPALCWLVRCRQGPAQNDRTACMCGL